MDNEAKLAKHDIDYRIAQIVRSSTPSSIHERRGNGFRDGYVIQYTNDNNVSLFINVSLDDYDGVVVNVGANPQFRVDDQDIRAMLLATATAHFGKLEQDIIRATLNSLSNF